MKITKQQLKELIREQVAAVVNETDWRDVSDPDYHKPQGEAGPYADEMEDLLRRIMDPGEMSFDQAMDEFGDFMKKYTSAEPEVDDVEWMEDRFHQDQEDWPEEEEEVVDLRGKTPTRQSIARLKHRIKQHTGEEPVDLGHVDPRTGKVRVRESELKDMIRTTLEEVAREL